MILAFHQIGGTDGTKEQNTEVCAGILCCWLVDKSKGKEFNSNSTSPKIKNERSTVNSLTNCNEIFHLILLTLGNVGSCVVYLLIIALKLLI